ncbi:Rieske (2Fe-2S) protein [Candidatus Cyanaurora vandensis]|uniref:Rieske (2Fe-2S) protein n=1 Tax=Candidatus Cyanaurora vandensis TaxID=2714958 RepID=UPI0025797520|nr:Rieske (2Fe-2S) protein [Candidatus Cyanaurora vandensis]
MNWVKVLPQSELTPDARKVVTVGQRKILLLQHGGQVYAMDNGCPHLKLPLKGGKIQDGALVCPFHRSAFDLKTGNVKAWSTFPPLVGSLLGAISTEKPLTVYPVRMEGGSIAVGVED